MKLLKNTAQRNFRPRRRGGFTVVELLVATAVSMVLLCGAIYSSLETVAVVSAGDSRLNTQVHARRVLERLVKDCRYASAITVSGEESTGWTIDLITGLDDAEWTWNWDPSTSALSVSGESSTEVIVSGLTVFNLDTQDNETGDIERITMVWTILESASASNAATAETTATFPGSTWVRANMN